MSSTHHLLEFFTRSDQPPACPSSAPAPLLTLPLFYAFSWGPQRQGRHKSLFFFLVFLCKAHLLSLPHLPFCKVLPHSMETELCRSNKNHSRVIFFEGHLFIFPMLFASGRRSTPTPFFPSSLCPSKGSSRVRAMHRSATLPGAAMVTQQQQGLWVRRCPLPRQPTGCSVLRRQSWENRLPVCVEWQNQGMEEGWVQLSPLLIRSV